MPRIGKLLDAALAAFNLIAAVASEEAWAAMRASVDESELTTEIRASVGDALAFCDALGPEAAQVRALRPHLEALQRELDTNGLTPRLRAGARQMVEEFNDAAGAPRPPSG
jgi:hypothetical protein